MSSNWRFVPRTGLSASRSETDDLLIVSELSGHFYVPFGRDNTDFRRPPEQSSFALSTDSYYSISVELQSTDDIVTQLAIVEYTSETDRVVMGDSRSLTYIPSHDALSVSVALRVKGRGKLVLGDLAVQASQATLVEDLDITHPVSSAAAVRINIEAFSEPPGAKDAALALIQFTDAAGETLLPNPDMPMHPRLGAYSYISCENVSGTTLTSISMTVPPGAADVKVKGKVWKRHADVYISGTVGVDAVLQNEDHPNESIHDFVSQIPADDTLIVLYTTAPLLGHETLSLRPNRLAVEYLKMGAWVVFFPFSRVPSGSEFVADRCRQYSLDSLSEFLHEAAKRQGPNNVFICSSFPDLGAVTAIDLLRLRTWTTVYEVRDDMEEFNRVGYSKWFHPRLESRVARTVDHIITVSPRLAFKMDVLRAQKGAVVVPNAVSEELALKGRDLRAIGSARERDECLIVGYIGHLTPSWFDWESVTHAAETLPELTFEIIGHGAPHGLSLPPNISVLGPRTHDEFLTISRRWKIGLIPFKPSTLTSAVDPNKIYEYLAVGLRVVTARMGNVDQCPSTWVYDSEEQMVDHIRTAANLRYEDGEFERMDEYVGESLWPMRAVTMMKLMGVAT